MATLLKTPEFQLSLDNEVSYRVAINALHLRRYRKLSQAQVARAMGTSQPKVARIESGDDNITLATLRKIVDALDGRVQLSIQPKEIHLPRIPEWWEAPLFASETMWKPSAACIKDLGPETTGLLAAWTTERQIKDGNSVNPLPLELVEDVA